MFGQNNDSIDLKLKGLFSSSQKEDGEIMKELKKLDLKVTDKLQQLEMAITEKGYTIPVKSILEEPTKQEVPESISNDPPKKVTFQTQSSAEKNVIIKDGFWIEDIREKFKDDGLGEGEEKKLKRRESIFWEELIAKYLKPLVQTKVI